MRLAVIACRVFNRELSYEMSCAENSVDIYWLKQGLHNTPALLKNGLQRVIDDIDAAHEKDPESYDAVTLLYGLCSNSIIGLSSKRLPLIVPRCDDCIAVFLGSQTKYLEIFKQNKGTYWFNQGWYENGHLPCEERFCKLHKKYTEEYGEDNADYLIETEKATLLSYSDCACIRSPVYNAKGFFDFSKKASLFFHWRYNEYEGDNGIIRRLLRGEWNADEFIICQKGESIESDVTTCVNTN